VLYSSPIPGSTCALLKSPSIHRWENIPRIMKIVEIIIPDSVAVKGIEISDMPSTDSIPAFHSRDER